MTDDDRAARAERDLAEAQGLHRAGKVAGALSLYRRAIEAQPGHPRALAGLGACLAQSGDFAQAVGVLDRALFAATGEREAALVTANLGNALQELGRKGEALAAFDGALVVLPSNPDLHVNRGNVLRTMERDEEAVAAYVRALSLDSGHGRALLALAHVQRDRRDRVAALAVLERLLAIDPRSLEAHTLRGHVFFESGDFESALFSYELVVRLAPDRSGIGLLRADALRRLGRHEEAILAYEAALAAAPDHPDRFTARVSLGTCHLLLGQFAQGLPCLEARISDPRGPAPRPLDPARTLDGVTGVQGRTVLLRFEQGLGDAIQFCRYAPMLAERGASVVLEAPDALRELLASAPGVARVIPVGADPEPFDYNVFLASLPLAFGTRLDTIPAPVPYLRAPPEQRTRWRDRLGPRARPRVGLVWRGNARHENDAQRSIPIERIVPLLLAPGAGRFEWFNLQREASDAELLHLVRLGVRNVVEEITDLADTAAIVEELDLVISVDTSVAHLAGALGKPVWILLAFEPDWRWMLGRGDSPWYPTARLFRQPGAGDWQAVVEDVGKALFEAG